MLMGNIGKNREPAAMFKFFQNRASKKKKSKGDMKIELKKTELELDPQTISSETKAKRCPKCNRFFAVQAVICDFDSTLLMLTKNNEVELAKPITGSRLDGDTMEVLCSRRLGKGNLCDVYEAFDTSTQDRYVVKVLSESLVWDSKSAKRFVQGAKAAHSLEHENIVRTHSIGTVRAERGKSQPFVVCEYLEGKQLNELITKESLPSVAEVLDIFDGVCAALEYAHGQEVVHGDLKPTNIFLATTGGNVVPKVSDFAVAERLFRELEWDKVCTMTTSIYGCSTYLAPDFIDARLPTAVSDIYSVGCMMYECLTGAPPFTGGNDFVVILAHRDAPPKPFAADYTPKEVADLVLKALEKDPRKRWQSAGEMGQAIRAAKKKYLTMS